MKKNPLSFQNNEYIPVEDSDIKMSRCLTLFFSSFKNIQYDLLQNISSYNGLWNATTLERVLGPVLKWMLVIEK